MGYKKRVLFGIFITVFLLMFSLFFLYQFIKIDWDNLITGAAPFGAIVTENWSERGVEGSPESDGAMAGNITELVIFGYSLTQSWQGYVGNVTGTITLDDNENYTMYNWSAADPQGEVYAANDTVNWANVQCFNFTAVGDYGNYTHDVLQKGATNLYGKNLTMLESEFGISSSDMDGVNETFNFTYGSDEHDLFYVGDLYFSEGECLFTRTYSDVGMGTTNEFEEVLLWDPVRNNTIFTAILEQDVLGFNNRTYDFQMMVLENGHLGNTETTDYYFYVEVE